MKPYIFCEYPGGGELQCPFDDCTGVPHLVKVAYGQIPETSTEGQGCVMEHFCDHGHHWLTSFAEHSEGNWITVHRLKDLSLAADGSFILPTLTR